MLSSFFMLGLIGLGAVVFFFMRHILCGMLGLYRIVPINEAHIRVLKDKRDFFSSRTGKSSYWRIPYITKVHKLPLCNLAIPVNDVKLNDKNMAKFVCDIMCFINIHDIKLAVERLSLTDTVEDLGFDFEKLSEDLRAIMESIGRTVVTKQTILDIYMNRSLLDEAITKEVEVVFPKWGIELVDLELKDIKDAPQSTIIADIERKVAAEIYRDAEIKVATTTKEAEVVKAEAEEIYRKRQLEKDRNVGIANQEKEERIGIAEQEKNLKIADAMATANERKVEAARVEKVGSAMIEKESQIQLAEGVKQRMSIEAEGQASKTLREGTASADVVRISKEADAAGTLKLAEAMKQFNDVAIGVKLIDVQKEILLGKYKAFAESLGKAEIKWIVSGDKIGKIFGLDLDAETGANFNQMLEAAGNDGFLNKLLSQMKVESK